MLQVIFDGGKIEKGVSRPSTNSELYAVKPIDETQNNMLGMICLYG
jgi:hypothetical protein